MSSIAAKIKGLREAKGMSQLALAQAVPMTRGYLSLLEKGTSKNPGMTCLKGLAKALDVSIDYLTDESSSETRSWAKVAIDESMRLFLSKHDLSDKDISGFRRVSFQRTAPRSLADWDRLLINLNSFRQKALKRGPQIEPDADSRAFKADGSEDGNPR